MNKKTILGIVILFVASCALSSSPQADSCLGKGVLAPQPLFSSHSIDPSNPLHIPYATQPLFTREPVGC